MGSFQQIDLGASTLLEEEDLDDLELPTYTSVPLERVGVVQVGFIPGKQVPPLPYPLEEPPE